MNWQEIERSAEAYRARQVVVVAQREKVQKEQLRIHLEEEERRRQKEIQQAQEIIEKLGVREALETVRDEVWREGEIAEVVGQQGRGFQLLSDSYPRIDVRKEYGRLSIELRKEQTSLSVLVVPKKEVEPGFTESDSREKRVIVEDGNVFSIKSSYQPSPDTMRATIRSYGLEEGLRQVSKRSWIYVERSDIDPTDENAVGHFHNVLLTHVDRRISEQGLPATIRLWSENLVEQLPPTLRQTGRIGGKELREWGHRVAGTPGPVVILDRLLRRA